jgi:hypothetical protein
MMNAFLPEGAADAGNANRVEEFRGRKWQKMEKTKFALRPPCYI